MTVEPISSPPFEVRLGTVKRKLMLFSIITGIIVSKISGKIYNRTNSQIFLENFEPRSTEEKFLGGLGAYSPRKFWKVSLSDWLKM